MAKYTGKPVTVNRPAAELYGRISDLSSYKDMVDALPEQQRSRIAGINFTSDSVSFDTPGVGRLKFVVDELIEPSRVSFKAAGSPVPLQLSVDLKETTSGVTELTPAIDIEIPAVVRPFVGPKIQEAADRFGEVFATIVK